MSLSDKMWKPNSVSNCGKEGYFDTKDIKQAIKELNYFFQKPEERNIIKEIFGEDLV